MIRSNDSAPGRHLHGQRSQNRTDNPTLMKWRDARPRRNPARPAAAAPSPLPGEATVGDRRGPAATGPRWLLPRLSPPKRPTGTGGDRRRRALHLDSCGGVMKQPGHYRFISAV